MIKDRTGYPSIDRPQEKYYRRIPIKDVEPKQTIYELVFNANKDNLDEPAVGYLGRTFTYNDIKTRVDHVANSFSNMGIGIGDVVLIGISNSPEAVVSLLALNKIGAVSKWFDIRAGEGEVEEYINSSNCVAIIAYQMLLPKIESIIDNTKVKHVIVTNPAESLSSLKRFLYGMKESSLKLPKDDRYKSFRSLYKSCEKIASCVEFDAVRPSIMIQSSGTTGKPKTIVHSDLSVGQMVQAISYSDLPLGKGKTALVALPPWIAYGLCDAMVMPLTLGSKVELSPSFDADTIVKYLGKFTISFAAPFHYRYLLEKFSNLSEKQKKYVEMIETAITGGDKISYEENELFEKVTKTVLVNGYGNNEGLGVLTVNPCKSNKYGTVGIPKYGDTIISVDIETGEELSYGETGEICCLTDTLFIGYENNQEETDRCKRLHRDGKYWLHTGDLGYIDQDGFVSLSGRLTRVIVRLGFKIAAYTIEDKISECRNVKECVVVSVKDEKEEHVPMAYVVVSEDCIDSKDSLREQILELLQRDLKEYEIPKYIKFIDSMPYTANNKYDYRYLEKMGNEYIDSILTREQ